MKIMFVIHPSGHLEIEVLDIEGPVCEEIARKFLEELAGNEKVELRRKPEFDQGVSSRSQRSQTVRGGRG